jgi:TatD DNase family protein
MAPEPHRGNRCESAFVVDTARCLAKVKGLSLEEVAAITTENALRLFSTMR